MPLESLLEDFGSVLVVLLRIFRRKHIILSGLSDDLTVLHRKKRKKAMYARSNAFASQRPIFPVAILFVGYTGRYLHRGSLAIRSEVKCLTRPEIEMLVIIAEDCHDDFQKRRMKPSHRSTARMSLAFLKSRPTGSSVAASAISTCC